MLYKVQKEYQEILNQATEILDSADPDLALLAELEQKLQINSETFEQRSEWAYKSLKNIEAEIKSIDEEIKNLKTLKDRKLKLSQTIERSLFSAMKIFGKNKLTFPIGSVKMTSSVSTNTEKLEDHINSWFSGASITTQDYESLLEKLKDNNLEDLVGVDVELKPYKNKIKQLLKEGKDVLFCSLEPSEGLSFK